MNSLEPDSSVKLHQLELEWREHYEASMLARADYQYLSACGAGADLLDSAKELLDRAEALKARVLTRIDLLDDSRFAAD